MAGIKTVIGQKDGKTIQKELSEEQTLSLYGKKIGDKLKGDDIGFEGYEFEITGGSDNSGIPMRKDIDGIGRKRILAIEGIGLKKKGSGQRQRKNIRGNTISEHVSQLNIKVLKAGKAPLIEAEKKQGEENAEKPKKEKKEDKA